MRKFKGSIGTNVCGSDFKFEFEVEDAATEEEIEQEAWERAAEYINFYYEEERKIEKLDIVKHYLNETQY